jgi:hypothetical protein
VPVTNKIVGFGWGSYANTGFDFSKQACRNMVQSLRIWQNPAFQSCLALQKS